MTKKMDTNFWIPALIGFFLAVGGAALGLYSAYKSDQQSKVEKAKAEISEAETKDLLKQNNNKSIHIIAELNESSAKMKQLLDSTVAVLQTQKESGLVLAEQVKESTKINESINESGRNTVRSINEATKALDDNLTGGEAYCNIYFALVGKRSFKLTAKNHFNNKIPNARITVENYSGLEKCPLFTQNGIEKIPYACYTENTYDFPPMDISVGVDYYIEGEQFIDTSGKESKLSVKLVTPKNTFYIQILYSVVSDFEVKSFYRVLRRNSDRSYSTIVETSGNLLQWNDFFKIGPEIYIGNPEK